MQTLPLHVGVKESVQFADAEYMVISAAVATMVFPVKGTVKDIAVCSSTGAVDTLVVHVAGVGREVLVHSKRTNDRTAPCPAGFPPRCQVNVNDLAHHPDEWCEGQ